MFLVRKGGHFVPKSGYYFYSKDEHYFVPKDVRLLFCHTIATIYRSEIRNADFIPSISCF
jgi:hypothetical protein